MNATLRRLAAALATSVAAVLVASGIAGAYYSAVPASGTGSATPLSTAATLTLAVTGTAGSGLYPGGPGADVTVTVANPYDRAVTITEVVAAGTVTVTPLPGRTCATHGVQVAPPTAALMTVVPASSAGTTVVLPGAATMANGADNGCQGATFAIPFRLVAVLS